MVKAKGIRVGDIRKELRQYGDNELVRVEMNQGAVSFVPVNDEEVSSLGAVCENCGAPCEYDSDVCLCSDCEKASEQFFERKALGNERE